MKHAIVLFALCLVLSAGERAHAQDSMPLLTKEECARLEETFHDRLHRPEERGFYLSDEYRRCRDAAFSMEPNAGLEILNALTGEGEGLDLSNDIQRLEKRLFYSVIGNAQIRPHYMQCCYNIKKERWCEGTFADDSEHFDALLFDALELAVGKAERVTFHSDKPNYVLKSLFFNGQAVAFRQTGQTAWEATLPASFEIKRGKPFDFHILSAIFEWNGQGSENSAMGTFRKAVWYYKSGTTPDGAR